MWISPSSLRDLFTQWEGVASGSLQKKVLMVLFFSALWSIWLERNNVVFNDGCFKVEKTFFLIIHRADMWLKALGVDGPLHSQSLWLSAEAIRKFRPPPKPHRKSLGWQPPTFGVLKWNVDGSSLGKPGPAGVGGVLRDHEGLVKVIFSVPCGIIDSNLAEVIAIRKALQVLSLKPEYHNVNIIVESDSFNAISWLTNSEVEIPWKFHFERSLIDNLKNQFYNVSFIHTLRENNSMADAFAKQGVYRDIDFIAWL